MTASLRTLAAQPVMAGSDPGWRNDPPSIIRAPLDRRSRLVMQAGAAAVFDDVYPVQWTGQQAVVALPEHIDLSNAGQIREELLSVINRGAKALVADMTATISCDNAGADAVARAHQRAVISGTDLRLVVTAQIVQRVFSLSGLDRLVSIYPCLEAATAASAPAAALAPPTRPAPAITPAVVRKLIDALHDGVALAAGDGALVLANRRLADMFGYERAELLGRPVEFLIPARLQSAHPGHRASYAQVHGNLAASTQARFVGLRKDGTRLPVEISISPVTTGTGQFAINVIRRVTEGPRPEDRASLARGAVTAELRHRSRELLDMISNSCSHVGLSLQAAMELPAEVARQRIALPLRQLARHDAADPQRRISQR